MKILLIQLRQLGDILLTTPCVRAVREAFPDAQLDFLSHRMGSLILSKNSLIDSNLHYSENDGLKQQLALLRRIRHNRYDCVIDFMNNPRSALMTIFSGARLRVGFRCVRRLAYNRVIDKPSDDQYIARKKFSLLAPLGLNPADISLAFPFQESQEVHAFLEMGQLSGRAVIMSPTHRREARRWPLTMWAELAQAMEKESSLRVIWAWGPGERQVVQECQRLAGGAGFIAPETKLEGLAHLIAASRLFIGNSNGPSHIAVAVDTPSLQLHGPTKGIAWCPDTNRHSFLQSPTGAMSDISVGAVKHAIARLLSETPPMP